MIKIDKVEKYNDALLKSVNDLLPQLSSSAQLLDSEALNKIIESDASHLLIASDNDEVVGMLTLVLFPIPTGIRAWVEDVVVHELARGRGVGRLLIESAIKFATEEGAKTIDLTSRPSREAANRLYQKAGFKLRETNVYRFSE